jgi:hypothetical protein
LVCSPSQDFGTAPGAYDVEALLVQASPLDLCSDGGNFNSSGNIVLVQRGTCQFVDKALRAQKLEAKAIVVGNSENSGTRYIR